MQVLVSLKKGDFHYPKDGADYHCKEGIIKREDLESDKKIVISHTNQEFLKFTGNKRDISQRYKRGPQIITPKDLGYILARTYLSKDAKVVEAGGGSGAFSTFFGNYVKTIHTYEVMEDHIKIIEKNLELQDIKNVKLINGDINEYIEKEKDVDLLFLDMPDCQKVLEKDLSGIKSGGYIVCYIPSITQILDLNDVLANLREEILIEEVSEIIKRDWKVWGKVARPLHRKEIDHTAFLVFLRKI